MNAVIKYPGAKWSIAQWIISHFPKHRGWTKNEREIESSRNY